MNPLEAKTSFLFPLEFPLPDSASLLSHMAINFTLTLYLLHLLTNCFAALVVYVTLELFDRIGSDPKYPLFGMVSLLRWVQRVYPCTTFPDR
uniref:Uncharacterized protein n=1 Tax=Parascaris univalens TaxID=6257 RepID=A0A915CES3_PARUN